MATGVTVIRDAVALVRTGREPLGRHDVLIREGRIAAIRPAGEVTAGSDAVSIDSAPCTLMPRRTASVVFDSAGVSGSRSTAAAESYPGGNPGGVTRVRTARRRSAAAIAPSRPAGVARTTVAR